MIAPIPMQPQGVGWPAQIHSGAETMDIIRELAITLLREYDLNYLPEEIRADIDKLKVMRLIVTAKVSLPEDVRLFYEKVFLRDVFTDENRTQ